ncbi:MAG: thioesterase domain-containing protein, partial [Gemmatimonadaceae bacterium]
YHNRAELTAERFIADPFSPKAGARMYRTGDRARWLDDGTIEYLGRLDFQVKLRGFRIEVGEIEAVLASDPAVRTCAVLLRNDPGIEARLVAYYVPEPGASTTPDALRARLDTLLPSYMVPWLYVPVESMPLSPSGKLDRKALPAPEGVLPRAAAVAPRNDIEARVLAIWEHVLNRKNIGVTERFNEVGGNSLAAVRVFARIEREFEQKLQLVTMLKHDTVEKIAVLLREPARVDAWSCIVPFETVADGVPVFCPHAQTGNVLIYQHFAKEIGAHHPVYGIEAYGNWGDQEPHESMDEMIRFYVDEIVKVRPHGPYIFMGGSLGGYIALELARAMRARGEEVRMLAMYDTVGTDYPRYSLFGRIAKFVKSHGGFPLWRVQSVFHSGKERLTPRLVYWNLRKTLRWWYENTRRDYLYWKYEDANPPRDFAMPANLTRVRLASRRMLRGYRAEPYPGKITYFRADIQPTGAIHDPVNGWSGLAEEFEVHPVPAGHTGGMSYPVVVGLSKTFLECAKRAAVEAHAHRG